MPGTRDRNVACQRMSVPNEPFGLAHNVEVSVRSPITSTRLLPLRADSAAAAAESAGGTGGFAPDGGTTAADIPRMSHVTRPDAAFHTRVTLEQLNDCCHGVTLAQRAPSLPADESRKQLLKARLGG